MNRITRTLMMSGLGLAATLTLGVGHASAASATGQGTSSPTISANRHDDRDDYDFKRWYRDKDDCRDDGRRGERRDWWEDYYCDPDRTRHGVRWALMVQYDDDHDGRGGRHDRHDDHDDNDDHDD
jgi:hypothetical protein